MNTLVTCMGESLIDFVPLNATGQGQSAQAEGGKAGDKKAASLRNAISTDFRMHAGGSLFNVAVGIARLGQHAAFAGKIAEDFFGHYLLQTLQAEGIDTRFLTTAHVQSTLAIVAMEGGEP